MASTPLSPSGRSAPMGASCRGTVARCNQLLMAPAERADVIVDFTDVRRRHRVYLVNVGPDEPFGGIPWWIFATADSTGQVMQVPSWASHRPPDQRARRPADLVLPRHSPLGPPTITRQVSLNEEESNRLSTKTDGNIVLGRTRRSLRPDAALLRHRVER